MGTNRDYTYDSQLNINNEDLSKLINVFEKFARNTIIFKKDDEMESKVINTKEILYKQLQLLYERSQSANDTNLKLLTSAMVSVVEELRAFEARQG